MQTDNERFLKTARVKKVMKRSRVKMSHVPPRSPDLNLVERFWGWLRKEMRSRDLKDFENGRPVLTKAAYRIRVRDVCRTKRAQQAAKAFANGYRNVCKLVVKKQGAASGK